jgi:polysaccharide export outer membrane protein
MNAAPFLAPALLAAAFFPWGPAAAQDPPPAAPPAPEEPAPAAPRAEVATVKPGDSLDISVFGHPELSRVVTVQPDGSVSFPFLGRLAVRGRTTDDIARTIGGALEKDYGLREPRVSVAVASFGARSVYVLGRVKQAGSHEMPPARPLTLLQLLSLAGGFEEDADRGRVLVQRTGEDGTRGVVSVDLTAVESSGDMSADVELRDGDTVFVPRAEEVSVLGQVNRPGQFVMKAGSPLTVLRAIARAEGLTRLAKPSAVVWIRRTKEGMRRTTVDVDAILYEKAPDPVVSPGDVLFVPERAF